MVGLSPQEKSSISLYHLFHKHHIHHLHHLHHIHHIITIVAEPSSQANQNSKSHQHKTHCITTAEDSWDVICFLDCVPTQRLDLTIFVPVELPFWMRFFFCITHFRLFVGSVDICFTPFDCWIVIIVKIPFLLAQSISIHIVDVQILASDGQLLKLHM